MIINNLKSMRAENDFINHSLNQIFRWIFCRREDIKKSTEPKRFFSERSVTARMIIFAKTRKTIGQPDQSWIIAD